VSIKDAPSREDAYTKARNEADPDDFDDQYRLAKLALERQQYDEALAAIERALEITPRSIKAQALLRQIRAAKTLAEQEQPPDERPAEPAEGDGDDADPEDIREAQWLLPEQAVYHIRLSELREDDHVSVRFQDNVIDDFIERMRGWGPFRRRGFENEFRRYPPARKAYFIRRNVDRDNWALKDKIEVRSDPAFMVDFRQRVWPLVSQHCAAAHCHGSRTEAAGGLKLFRRHANVQADYTNFVILSSYVSRGRRMIYRDQPEKSLLLEFILPADQAKYVHPEVLGLRKDFHVVPNRDALTYRQIVEWIRELRMPRQPDYHLNWNPPLGMKLNLTGRPSLPDPESPKKKADAPAPDEAASPATNQEQPGAPG
jgi:tetratricopeptide (TPR) repeat protein